jgi:hypothetical protein
MFRHRRSRSLLRRTARVALTLSVLLGLLAGAVGFPVAPPELLNGDFPCQGHGCGCRSAEECWLGCCCLTPSQRLAWAKRRGVTPPAELVELADLEASTTNTTSCCSGHGAACCRHKSSTDKACCGGKATARNQGSRPDDKAPGFGFTTIHCRGFVQLWAATGQPLALPERGLALSGGMTSTPLITASTNYTFLPSPPPTRPG